jgi:hypothetical protein
MELFSQNKSSDREPVAAGRFYSADKVTLTKDIAALFEQCAKPEGNITVRAIVAPHAGYVYSGKTAAAAFSSTSKAGMYKNIFLIGSSHIMAFEGASVYSSGDFITPLGKARVNKEIASKLKTGNKVFDFPETAHIQDHTLEVQLPLIQYYYSKTPDIVPIIIGTSNTTRIKEIANALRPYFTTDNLFVFSSDFSHYPSYKDAVEIDNLTAVALTSGNPSVFLETLKKNSSKNLPGLATSMCGWTSGLALLYLVDGNTSIEFKRIDYCNSGDSQYGAKNEVVGYHAIALTEKKQDKKNTENVSEEFSFTAKEKEQLFSIARNSINTKLNSETVDRPDVSKLSETLKMQFGAFVTLKIDGILRGCIGRFTSSDPLFEVVRLSALSSAFEDPRFPPLTKEEYKKTEIEITVLGPMKKIKSIDEIILGKHGIYIKKDYKAGTMLPQVATENRWTVEEFLGYTSRDKAGLGWSGWRDAEIFIYEGVVLEENKK